VSPSAADIEFFELTPAVDDRADAGYRGASAGPGDCIDLSRADRAPRHRMVMALAVLGLVVVVTGLEHKSGKLQPGSAQPGVAVEAVEASAAFQPRLPDIFALPRFSSNAAAAPTPVQGCPAGSRAVRATGSTVFVSTLVAHLTGLVVDGVTRLVNEQGQLCSAYLAAHTEQGVSIWVAASARSDRIAPGTDVLDYGPPTTPVHSVSVVTAERAGIDVVAQGPPAALPSASELIQLAIDPGLLS
jgi:hypothetical protein